MLRHTHTYVIFACKFKVGFDLWSGQSVHKALLSIPIVSFYKHFDIIKKQLDIYEKKKI